MQRNLKEFINEALCQPNDFLPYFVSQKLAEWYPESAILENESWTFDLREYAAAGLCSLWPQEPVHCQVETTWYRNANTFEQELENGWYTILWPDSAAGGREHLLEVVQLTWLSAGGETTRRWIIAEAREVAEQFLRAVCEYGEEVHGEILVYEEGYWCKDDKLFASIKSATFDNLILPPQLKQELREDFRRFFASREVYERYGIPWKRGAFLFTAVCLGLLLQRGVCRKAIRADRQFARRFRAPTAGVIRVREFRPQLAVNPLALVAGIRPPARRVAELTSLDGEFVSRGVRVSGFATELSSEHPIS